MKKRLLIILCAMFVLPALLVTGCDVGSGGKKSDEVSQSSTETASYSGDVRQVTNYKLDDARTYTGTLVNGLPEGEGVLVWDSGCIYRGHFKKGRYDGYGTFDWRVYNPDGSVKSEGWLYEGEFKNNTMAGCRGKLTLDQTNTQEGIIWIEGEMSGFPAIKREQSAVAFIRYGDKTTYLGVVYYNSYGVAERKGHGIQDFSPANLGYGSAWGCKDDELFYAYEGEFDYTVSGWIYGNGVMYYKDYMGMPTRYAKGFFSACHLLGEYEGEEPTLIKGYTADMESKYIRFRENYDVYTTSPNWAPRHVEYLFVGHSYFTFMNIMEGTPFSKYFGDYDALDVGCGGATTADWLNYYDALVKPYTPDKIVIAIGGNDIGNFGTPETVYENLKKFMTTCRNDNPNVKFYLIGEWITPATVNNYAARDQLDQVVFPQLKEEFSNTVYIPVNDLLYKDAETREPVDDFASYFLSDGLHMNDKGYVLWTTRIKEYL